MAFEVILNMSIMEYIKSPKRIVLSLGNHQLINWMPDKLFISLAYQARMGKKLDWSNLKTFNEKQQWIKLYDRNALYTQLVDKYAVREYVRSKIGEAYLIPNYGVWDSFDEINFSKLPNEFVVKCTHDGGSVFICTDKSSFDYDTCRNKINKALKRNFYWHSREWPYKNVKPRIIAEELLIDSNGNSISDYKLQCFNGKFDNVFVCTGRFSNEGVRYYYFDKDWNLLPYSKHECSISELEKLKPKHLEEMIILAEKLSAGIPEVRVDFYEVNGQIYFGELTFFSSGGCDPTITEEADRILGGKLILPIVDRR